MAIFELIVPNVGTDLLEAEFEKWHVEEGNLVDLSQNIVTLITDKATIDIESPYAGVLVKQMAQRGDVVNVGSTIGLIDSNKSGIKMDDLSLPKESNSI